MPWTFVDCFAVTSIDELFQKSSVPGKRKLEVSHDPSQYYKSAKLSANGDAKGKSHATVEDEPEDVEEDDGVEAGPALPPDEDEDEDEEGGFFGGGVDNAQLEALDFVERREKETAAEEQVVYDSKWVRKLASNLEKRISRNEDLRAKYGNDPEKFMASEADLDDQIKSLSVLSEHPELYQEFAKLGCVESLVNLLAHENTDIAVDAIEILSELVSEDLGTEEDQIDAIVDAAINTDILSLLASNLKRLDEEEETDRNGVNRALSILETLASRPTTADRIGKHVDLVDWLLARIQSKPNATFPRHNKQTSAEVLSSVLGNSITSRQGLIKRDTVNTCLELLAPHRRNYPADDTEAEFVENLFDILTALADESTGKLKLLEAEGVELMLIYLRENKQAKVRALTVLDHATGGGGGAEVCAKLVEAQGLKTVFGTFMKAKQEEMTGELVEHILGIFVSLLRSLPNDSAERIRTLAKFVEKDYEKIQQLIKVRRTYGAQLMEADDQIAYERKQTQPQNLEDMEVGWLARRLDAGLLSLQALDEVLAWLIAEDGGAKRKVVKLLGEQDESLDDVRKTLQQQVNGISDADEEAQVVQDILTTLIPFLEAPVEINSKK